MGQWSNPREDEVEGFLGIERGMDDVADLIQQLQPVMLGL